MTLYCTDKGYIDIIYTRTLANFAQLIANETPTVRQLFTVKTVLYFGYPEKRGAKMSKILSFVVLVVVAVLVAGCGVIDDTDGNGVGDGMDALRGAESGLWYTDTSTGSAGTSSAKDGLVRDDNGGYCLPQLRVAVQAVDGQGINRQYTSCQSSEAIANCSQWSYNGTVYCAAYNTSTTSGQGVSSESPSTSNGGALTCGARLSRYQKEALHCP
jgi:hypothetical protein